MSGAAENCRPTLASTVLPAPRARRRESALPSAIESPTTSAGPAAPGGPPEFGGAGGGSCVPADPPCSLLPGSLLPGSLLPASLLPAGAPVATPGPLGPHAWPAPPLVSV